MRQRPYILITLLHIFIVTSCGQKEFGSSVSSQGADGLCSFVKASSRIMGAFGSEVGYLCDQGGIATLAEKDITLLSESENRGTSSFKYGASLTVDADVSDVDEVFQMFCTNFSGFRAVAPEAYKRYESVVSNNVTSDGCRFRATAKKVLWYRPAYDGAVAIEQTKSEQHYAFASYLTRSISIIKDAAEFVVAHRNDDNTLQITGVFRHRLDSKGFHAKTKEEIQASVTALRKGIGERLGSY